MTNDYLTVSLVQYAPCKNDTERNLSRLDEMIRPLAGKTDLIVLPEMFPTGFVMNTGHIADTTGSYPSELFRMQGMAKAAGATIAGSMAVFADGLFRNRFYWVDPEGRVGHYDKHHLFTMSGEPLHFSPGTERKRFNVNGWEIMPIVCYDLRFPCWCRNTRNNPYDLLICSASWPAVRNDVWLTLMKARALENQSYVAGVNRVGLDENNMPHRGDSSVYGPKGEVIGKLRENEEDVASFRLSLPELHKFREKFPVLDDMDDVDILPQKQ